MTMLRYSIQTGANGSVLIPATPFADGAEIEVVLMERYRESQPIGNDGQLDPARILSNGKTAVDDFLDFCKELNMPPMTDEQVEQTKYDYLMEKYG